MKTNKIKLMKTINLKFIAYALAALMLMQSCTVYQGNYSLKTAIKSEKKAKVRIKYNEFLLYGGNRFKYNRFNKYDAWTLIQPYESLPESSDSLIPVAGRFSDIILFEGKYFGVHDFSDRKNWIWINPLEVKEVPTTKKRYFNSIMYQEGKYWGVPNKEQDPFAVYDEVTKMNLVPIDKNQVNKVSLQDPVLSVLATILAVPLAIGLILIFPIE
jgi:hypothetical protein